MSRRYEQQTLYVPLRQLNPHISCSLCRGYLVDATTIVECLHTFCRSCIVKHVENSNHCPTCDCLIHETQPLQLLKADRTLQDIIGKLLPELARSECDRERRFYGGAGAASSLPAAVAGARGPAGTGGGGGSSPSSPTSLPLPAAASTLSRRLPRASKKPRGAAKAVAAAAAGANAEGEERIVVCVYPYACSCGADGVGISAAEASTSSCGPQCTAARAGAGDAGLKPLVNNFIRCPSKVSVAALASIVAKHASAPPGACVELVCQGRVLAGEMSLRSALLRCWHPRPLPMKLHYRLSEPLPQPSPPSPRPQPSLGGEHVRSFAVAAASL